MSLRSMRPEQKQENSSVAELLKEQSKRISELEVEVQTLSSENLKLMNELQQKSAKIERLSESDLVLKQNAELQKQNEQLRKDKDEAVQKASDQIAKIDAEYRRKEINLQQQASELAGKQAKLAQDQTMLRSKIDNGIREHTRWIEAEYRGLIFGSIGYALLLTVFTAVRSERVVADFKAFFSAVWVFLSGAWEKLLQGANWASQVADKIPNDIVAMILHWVIVALVVIIALGAVGLILFAVGWAVVVWYIDERDGFADAISLAQILIALAVLIWFAEPIRAALPINLVFMLILSHVVFIGCRWGWRKWKESR